MHSWMRLCDRPGRPTSRLRSSDALVTVTGREHVQVRAATPRDLTVAVVAAMALVAVTLTPPRCR
ncbi:protein of unknown function [Micropruina glycogenica]|uniref:Uncharacterized protein n=1 Tax=Micropruina glycogenica TaxID=75385 RepID=A0A2N9JH70_9ACTN|nr:protein of unknown function [Micropruina glycogenica]